MLLQPFGQIARRLPSQIVPGDNGGKCEQHHRCRHEVLSQAAQPFGKAVGCKSRAIVSGACRVSAGHAEDDKGRHGTDQNGIEEHFEHGPHALLLRRRLLSRSMQNGHAAQSGLIGEHASGHAILKALGDSISRSPGYSRSRLQRIVKNRGENSGDLVVARHDDHHGKQHINPG